jgi:integrase/recombinase XerC
VPGLSQYPGFMQFLSQIPHCQAKMEEYNYSMAELKKEYTRDQYISDKSSENVKHISVILPNKDGTPLSIYFEEFEKSYLRCGKSEVTVRGVKDVLKFMVKHTSIQTIEDCNDSNLLEDVLYEKKEEREWKGSTLNSYLKSLKTYFIWLERKGHIECNNLGKVQKCKEEQNEQYMLSQEEVERVIAQAHTRRQTRLQRYRNVFFIDLLAFTGARPSELLNIKTEHITKIGDTYKLAIRGTKQKGGIRYHRFPSWLRDSYKTYREYRDQLRPNEPFLFVSSSKMSKWTYKGMLGLFRRLSKELGFRVIAYGFRRFVATHLHEQGVALEEIKNHFGHTRVGTTEGYIARSCALTEESGKVMGKLKM